MKYLNRIRITRIGLLTVVFVLLSCSAEDCEDGAIGPQGPQGEQGPVGADGQDGQNGTDGQDGADGIPNIISSGWFGIDTWDTDTPRSKVHKIPNLEFTDSQLESDLILVYRRYRPNAEILYINTLPIIEHLATSGSLIRKTQSDIFLNELYIQIFGFGFDIRNNEYLPPETQFRYIIIPAEVTTSKNAPDFSKMNYQEVMDHFGLEQ